MNGWVKYFSDGSQEVGTDEDVRMKRASWSRGRLWDMEAACISYRGQLLCLQGHGDFWQSDDYDAHIFETVSSLQVRRIQKRITQTDMWLYSYSAGSGRTCLVVQDIRLDPHTVPPEATNPQKIPSGMVGKWLTIEYDVISKDTKIYFADERI